MDKTLKTLLRRSQLLLKQQCNDKNKLYNIHDPGVRCFAKGKAYKRYEFGSRASFATTSKALDGVSAKLKYLV